MSRNEKIAINIEDIGKETGPLSEKQLSENELTAIIEIEGRLREIQHQAKKKPTNDVSPLAIAQQFYERVLLIDGGRGTGKSSLLQTLLKRWTEAETQSSDNKIPAFVKALCLDFDPLPHEMPLIAGIVQSWKPLAVYYDKHSGGQEESDDESVTLEDRWHRLFHVTAVGWSETPREGGLIEQVLNREDQVQDWYCLAHEWRNFVNDVIKAGRGIKGSKYRITDTPVFVIAIDDVDLQVERMRELLPALRLLYHPNVVFIVAADKFHMMDMLQLSFLGQQRQLENSQIVQISDKSREEVAERKETWPDILAQESIRKTFPLRNIWSLRKLSLRELLKFPRDSSSTFQTYFGSWPQLDTKKSGKFGNLAEYFNQVAGNPDDPIQLPSTLSYRAADQIFKRISSYAPSNPLSALTAIRDILAESGEDSVRITGHHEVNNQECVGQIDEEKKDAVADETYTNSTKEKDADANKSDSNPSKKNNVRFTTNIIYRGIGDLKAVFPDVFVHDTGNDSQTILSGYPSFIYLHGQSRRPKTPESPEFVAALIAGSLRDDGYGVLAPGLQWNIRTAIAWTSVHVLDLGLFLTLRWQWHIHPSPLRLYEWANKWSQFIETLSTETKNLDSRIAYAWIYCQLNWLGTDVSLAAPKLPLPTTEDLDPKDYWSELLRIKPTHGTDTEISRWKSRTLPLMARPELWLPPSLQKLLLSPDQGTIDVKWLGEQRERLITDGIIASQTLGMPTPRNPEEQQLARRAAEVFDNRHCEVYKERSAWEIHIKGDGKGK